VGVDNTQGDLMDSHGYDIFGKVAYWFTPEQHVNFEINRFESKGDMNYLSVAGDRDAGIPTTSVKGDPEGLAPRNQVLTTSVSYQHDDFYGTVLNAQAYRQEFEGLFGATLTSTFQDAKIAPVGTLYDQSQANSEKLGAKLTVSKDELLIKALKLTGGIDLLKDTTDQTLELTNRVWVPESTFNNYAPFLQAEIKPFPSLVLHTGVRYEHAELDVASFTTIASAKSVFVSGGKPEFSETLRNYGLVYTPWTGISLFANYSEGFGMPDVGRVLRGINTPNLDIDNFLNLEPILTDNREIGLRYNRGAVSAELSYYESNSDLGARLQRINGIYFVTRERTDIDGYEANLGYKFSDAQRLKLGYARGAGEYDSNADGKLDARLDGLNIAPNRLVLTWDASWSGNLNSSAQVNYAFDRTFDDPLKEFHGYALVDLTINYRLPVGQLSGALTNALNEDYYTYYSQSAVAEDERYFKGRGRSLVLGYSLEF
jgi:iron complex outermembrane receptor protein